MPAARLTCKQLILEYLAEYLDSSLDSETVQALERHLADCPACVAYLRTYRATRDLVHSAGRSDMPPELRSRLRGFLLQHLSGQA